MLRFESITGFPGFYDWQNLMMIEEKPVLGVPDVLPIFIPLNQYEQTITSYYYNLHYPFFLFR